MKQSIGLTILKNLGLTEEEAEILEKQRPEKINTVYARDQSGLGYKKPSMNYIAEANDIFAKLSARVTGSAAKTSVSVAQGSGIQTKRFIPTRLKKKSIGSLSHEDLATILCEPDEPAGTPIEAMETTKVKGNAVEQKEEGEHKKRRRRHRKSEEAQEQAPEQEADVEVDWSNWWS